MSDTPINPDWDGRMRAQAREPKPARPVETVTHGKACAQCGGTEFVCADCNGIITGEAAEEIRREIREGTPDTPERIAAMKRADEAYARTQRGVSVERAAPREPPSGPWRFYQSGSRHYWVNLIDRTPITEGRPAIGPLDNEVEAIAVRDALNAAYQARGGSRAGGAPQ